MYRRDRGDFLGDKTGGGVALCISNAVFSCRRKDLEPSEEVVICELRPEHHSKILIVLAYRPPSGDINKFLDNMNPALRSAMTKFNNVYFLVDFNMSNIDWETYSSNCTANNDFCSMNNQNNLIQLNKCYLKQTWQFARFSICQLTVIDH